LGNKLKKQKQFSLEGIHIRKDETNFPVSINLEYIKFKSNKIILAIIRDISSEKIKEKALSESESKFKQIAESSIDVIFTANNKGIVTYVSPAVEKLLSRKVKDVLGHNYMEFVCKNSIEETKRLFLGTLSGKTIEGTVIELCKPDKTKVWVEINASPIIKENKIIGCQGVARDVTLRVNLEKNLMQARIEEMKAKEVEWLASLPRKNPNIVMKLTNKGTLLYQNNTAKRKIGDTIPKKLKNIIIKLKVEKLKSEIEIKDKIYLFTIIKINEKSQINVYGTDITELKEQEKQVELLLEGFETSPNSQVIVEYCGEPKIKRINKAFTKYYGYTTKEVIGKNPSILKSGKQTKEYYTKMWKNLLNSKIGYWHDEIINKTKKNKLINVILTISTVFYNNEPVYFVANHINISKIKEVEQKLIEQKKELQNKIKELERFTNIVIGRELKMVQLKNKIKKMEKKSDKTK